jgi:hypothetical protein
VQEVGLVESFAVLPSSSQSQIPSYILLSGLRNGHLLAHYFTLTRNELQVTLTGSRKMGVSPVSLVRNGSHDSLLVLCDSSWLIDIKHNFLDVKPILMDSQVLYAVPTPTEHCFFMIQSSFLKLIQLFPGTTVKADHFSVFDIPRKVLYDSVSGRVLVSNWRKAGKDVISELKVLSLET